jgi:hypothetical protein
MASSSEIAYRKEVNWMYDNVSRHRYCYVLALTLGRLGDVLSLNKLLLITLSFKGVVYSKLRGVAVSFSSRRRVGV